MVNSHRDRLLFGQFLRVLEQDPLELILGPGLEEPLPQVHIGEQRGKRAPRFQCILRAFLMSPKQKLYNGKQNGGNITRQINDRFSALARGLAGHRVRRGTYQCKIY